MNNNCDRFLSPGILGASHHGVMPQLLMLVKGSKVSKYPTLRNCELRENVQAFDSGGIQPMRLHGSAHHPLQSQYIPIVNVANNYYSCLRSHRDKHLGRPIATRFVSRKQPNVHGNGISLHASERSARRLFEHE